MDALPWIVTQAVTIAFFGAGLWLAGLGFIRLCFPNPELGWIPVPGKVRKSLVGAESTDDGVIYSAKLQYAYEFRGATYLGSRIAPLELWSSSERTAASYALKYPVGRDVTVYVNPRNPGKTVLEPGRQVIAALTLFLLGVVFLSIVAIVRMRMY